jgi:dipeptide/tripeptide permease
VAYNGCANLKEDVMDKETIDYAITKLDVALQKVAPTAVELGQDMINYMVFKEALGAAIAGVIFILIVIVARIAYKYVRKTDDDDCYVPVFAIGHGLAVVSFIAFLGYFYDAMLANAFPLMWTIEHLVR